MCLYGAGATQGLVDVGKELVSVLVAALSAGLLEKLCAVTLGKCLPPRGMAGRASCLGAGQVLHSSNAGKAAAWPVLLASIMLYVDCLSCQVECMHAM